MEDVKKVARKAMLMGIGLGAIAKEAAQKAQGELLRKGAANEKKVKAFASKAVEAGRKQQRFVELLVAEEVKTVAKSAAETMKRMKATYEKQINELQGTLKTGYNRRIQELRRKVKAAKAKAEKPAKKTVKKAARKKK